MENGRNAESVGDISNIIRSILDLSCTLTQIGDRKAIMDRVCQAAVEMLNVDHSGIVEFDDDERKGRVTAEYPAKFGAVDGRDIFLTGIPAEERLIRNRDILHYPALKAARLEWGDLYEILIGFGIQSILIVPIVNNDRVVGSLSLDLTNHERGFTETEILLCQLLASLASNTLDMARSAESSDKRVATLGAAAMKLGQLDGANPEARIVNLARDLTNGADASVYLWFSDTRVLSRSAETPGANSWPEHLTVVATPEAVHHTGQGIDRVAIRLIASHLPFILISGESPQRTAVLGVLIGDAANPEGVLIVESRPEAHFTRDQVDSLRIFGQYAGNSLIGARGTRKVRFFKELSERTLGEEDAKEAVRIFVESASRYFPVEICRVVLWDGPGRLWIDQVHVRARQPSPQTSGTDTFAALRTLLNLELQSVECREADPQYGPLLKSLSTEAVLSMPVRWALLQRVRINDGIAGWFILATTKADPVEFRYGDTRRTVLEIASRISLRLSRLRMRDLFERRSKLLTKLQDLSGELLEGMALAELQREIVRLSVGILSGEAGVLLEVLPNQGLLRVVNAWPANFMGENKSLPLREPALTVLKKGRSTQVDTASIVISPALGQFLTQYQVLAIAPLKIAGPDFNSLLIVAFASHRELHPEAELYVLDSFCARASSALSHATLSELVPADGGKQRTLTHVRILYELAKFALAEPNKKLVLRAVLTGVTAFYGMRINRAAILLVKPSREQPELVGEDAVGSLQLEEAEADWENFHKSGLTTFQTYLDSLRRGLIHDNELAQSIGSLRTVLRPGTFERFSRVLAGKRAHLLSGNSLPDAIGSHLQPGTAPVAVIPLVTSSGTVEGVLLADNKHTRVSIDDIELELLSEFGQIAAEAIEKWRGGRRSTDWQMPTPTADATPRQILAEMLDSLKALVPYSAVAVLLTDEKHRPRDLVVTGMERPQDPMTWMRPDGYSRQVIETGRSVFLDNRRALADRVNQNVSVESFRPQFAFPSLTTGGAYLV